MEVLGLSLPSANVNDEISLSADADVTHGQIGGDRQLACLAWLLLLTKTKLVTLTALPKQGKI